MTNPWKNCLSCRQETFANRYPSSGSCDTIIRMAYSTSTVIELRLEGTGSAGAITCPAALRPEPGQYLAANSADPDEPLPVILYPTAYSPGRLSVAAPLPAHWKVGTLLQLRGPLGKGFQMPSIARRVAIASLEDSPVRLLPLVERALAQGAAVALYTRALLPGLPPEVEILTIDLLPEAQRWADFLALETRRESLPEVRARLGLAPHRHPDCATQIMLLAGMPCAGLAGCGICAAPTREGWSHACSDGPVYNFSQLDLGG